MQIVYIYLIKRLHSSNYLFSTQVTLISTQVLCCIKNTLSPPITRSQTQPTSTPSTPNSPYYSYSHLYSHHKSLILSQIPKPLQLSLFATHSPPRNSLQFINKVEACSMLVLPLSLPAATLTTMSIASVHCDVTPEAGDESVKGTGLLNTPILLSLTLLLSASLCLSLPQPLSAYLHEDGAPSEGWISSECCSQTKFVRQK